MLRYFDIAENQSKLNAAVQAWLGVPYEHMGRSRLGIDCVGLVGEIFKSCGVLAHMTGFAFYSHDWYLAGKNTMLEAITDNVERSLRTGVLGFAVERGEPQAGDLVCLTVKSKVVNHAVVMVSTNRFIHATPKAGVICDDLRRWLDNIDTVYRFWKDAK